MRILLTNDDGIEAKGLQTLAAALAARADVYIAAPSCEQSGASQSITVKQPVTLDDYDMGGVPVKQAWRIGGTPADCVKLALEELLPTRPDVVVSGINHGANLGSDVLYSGTVSAAIEGARHNIPALAVSMDIRRNELDFTDAAAFAADFAVKFVRELAIGHELFNVNIPAGWRGAGGGAKVCLTKLGVREYVNTFSLHYSPEGRRYYVMGGEVEESVNGADTDVAAVARGCISVTPLHFNMMDYNAYAKLYDYWERIGGR